MRAVTAAWGFEEKVIDEWSRRRSDLISAFRALTPKDAERLRESVYTRIQKHRDATQRRRKIF